MFLKYLALVIVILIVIAATLVRFSPIEAIDYQFEEIQPLITRGESGKFSVGVEGDLEPVIFENQSAKQVALRLEEILEATPRTTILAGWLSRDVTQEVYNASYITRSAVWGFPDVTSVRVETTGNGAAVLMHGRLVYGEFDFGVNEARIRNWLEQLTQ